MENEFTRRVQQKLQEALEKTRLQRMEDDRRRLMSTIGQDLATMMQPFLVEIASSAKANKETLRDAMFEAIAGVGSRETHIDTAPIIGAIEAAFMNIQMPEPKVTVTVPEDIFKGLKLPDAPDMSNVRGVMALLANGGEVGYNNPLPVILYDAKGNPLKIFEQLTQQIGGGGGISSKIVKIGNTADNPVPVTGSFTVTASGATQSVNVVDAFGSTAVSGLFNADNRLRVSVETGGSGITDAEIRASALPVAQVSGAAWSTSVNDIFGSVGANVINPDGRIKVELPSGASGLTDTELRASAVPVTQVSGAAWSTQASDIFSTLVASVVVNPDNRVRVEMPAYTQPISVTDIFATTAGSNVVNPDNRIKVELPATTVLVSDITASLKSALIDSSGIQYSGSNPVPVGGTVIVSSITATTTTRLDSPNGPYSAANPLPMTVVSGALNSSAAVYTRQANPAAVASDYVPLAADDLGRQLVRPLQVRDLIFTAYASVTNGTETTLLGASAGNFHDLIMVVGSNNSDAAVSVDIRAVTGGNVINTLRIPANGTAGWTPPVPWPQDATGNNWTIDGPDETGRTLTFSALFSREV